MVSLWQPGTYYASGSVVEYEGVQYKIIQPHTSQGDWTPPVTPALWGRMEGHEHHEYHPSQQPEKAPAPEYPSGQYNQPHPDQQVQIHPEERKKNWWDLDDKRKKELEIGGGLLAGVAALGAGYFAYKKHEKNEEEEKAQTWALQNWLHDAQNRTQDYERNGLRSPAQWILTQGRNIPSQAILVGPEHSWNLYICRAFHDGSLQIGKASEAFKKGAVIGYAHEEIHLDTYEILVGDIQALRWEDSFGRLEESSLRYRPVEGGRESDGTPLYIARAAHNGALHPGKASSRLDGAMIPYDGTEKLIKEYKVLCYNG